MLLISKEMQTEIDFIYNLYKKGFVGIEELQKIIHFFAEKRAREDLKKNQTRLNMIKKIKLFLLKMKIAIYEYQLKKIAKDYWREQDECRNKR